MGWTNGTEIFDGAVDVALDCLSKPLYSGGHPRHEIGYVVEKMYTEVDWDDWDTQDESKYFEPFLRKVMTDLGEIDD